MRFPDSSAGKEFACNAADPSSIPGSGRSAGEGIGYPLQYSWASPVARLVENPPAMQETWVRSLGWEDPLEKGKAAHSCILAWRIPWTVYFVRTIQGTMTVVRWYLKAPSVQRKDYLELSWFTKLVFIFSSYKIKNQLLLNFLSSVYKCAVLFINQARFLQSPF